MQPNQTMIYNDATITDILRVCIEPFDAAQVNSHSYDVTLASKWCYETPQGMCHVDADLYLLMPGEAVLASTLECLDLPDRVVAYLSMKSSLARTFLNHAMAGWIWPRFKGNVTLELFNMGKKPIRLTKGQRIAQLTFMPAQPALMQHSSCFNSTEGTVPSPLSLKLFDADTPD